jgi:hypothetical protein
MAMIYAPATGDSACGETAIFRAISVISEKGAAAGMLKCR